MIGYNCSVPQIDIFFIKWEVFQPFHHRQYFVSEIVVPLAPIFKSQAIGRESFHVDWSNQAVHLFKEYLNQGETLSIVQFRIRQNEVEDSILAFIKQSPIILHNILKRETSLNQVVRM